MVPSHIVKGVIPTLINDVYPNYITLGRSSSYQVKGWELGQHGDVGANGSRGSLLQFRKLNTKIIVGIIVLVERWSVSCRYIYNYACGL
jgi:hypothetical protein